MTIYAKKYERLTQKISSGSRCSEAILNLIVIPHVININVIRKFRFYLSRPRSNYFRFDAKYVNLLNFQDGNNSGILKQILAKKLCSKI